MLEALAHFICLEIPVGERPSSCPVGLPLQYKRAQKMGLWPSHHSQEVYLNHCRQDPATTKLML